jgi:hypothetical protein
VVWKHTCDFCIYKVHSAGHLCVWKLSAVSCFILYSINFILVFITGISSLCFKVAHSMCVYLWNGCWINLTLLDLHYALSDSLSSVWFYFSNIMQINSPYSHWTYKINGSLLYQWSSSIMPPVSKARATNTYCCLWWSWPVEQAKELFKFQVSSWGNGLLLMTLLCWNVCLISFTVKNCWNFGYCICHVGWNWHACDQTIDATIYRKSEGCY